MAKKRKTKKFDEGGVAEAKPAWMTEDERGIEPVYPEELLPIGKALSGITRAVTDRRVRNVLGRVEGGKFGGRTPQSEKDITHAYRSTTPKEVEDIKNVGYARRNPGSVKENRGWDKDNKYWSPGDEQGIFGRTWAKGSETIRAPIGKVKDKNWAVGKKDLERLNKETGKFEPLKKGGAVKAKKNSASSRGDGCAQRGKTKGRIV